MLWLMGAVVSDLSLALQKVKSEIYHFITIDMQLDESNVDAHKFEGWDILEIIKKLRVQDITPAMVITGFNKEYKDLKEMKKLESIFFMYKGKFDRTEFIDIVERAVKSKDLRFKDDHRGN